jgi:RNase P/RNase MRP subunit p30
MGDINFFKTKNSLYFKKISKKTDVSLNDLHDGYFIDSKATESEARKIIASLDSLKKNNFAAKKKLIAIEGNGDVFNRRAIETLKINYLVSPENNTLKDTLKQRDSGLNHVTAKIAKQKNIAIIINLSNLTILNPKQKATKLAKIMQNIKICKKTNTSIKIASFSDSKKQKTCEKTKKSLLSNLGMHTQDISLSTKF